MSARPPQPRLHGKVAIVTGAAMGLGEAIARRFAEEGARVACMDLRPGPNDAVVDAIRAAGGEADARLAGRTAAHSARARGSARAMARGSRAIEGAGYFFTYP